MAAEREAPCELLEWDSEHFGFPIAKVLGDTLSEPSVDAIDAWCAEHGIRCLYFATDGRDPETARIAAAHAFRVVDVHIISRRSYEGLLELPVGSEKVTVREATRDDLDYARRLAARSHRTSRFYFDGGFPRDRCDALYEAWIERGVGAPRLLGPREPCGRPSRRGHLGVYLRFSFVKYVQYYPHCASGGAPRSASRHSVSLDVVVNRAGLQPHDPAGCVAFEVGGMPPAP